VARIEQFAGAVVVQLFVDRGPVLEALGNGALGNEKIDVDRRLRAVAGRLQAGEFEPRRHGRIALAAIAVHAAVASSTAAKPAAVRRENAVDHCKVFHIRRAFVVEDDVKARRPKRAFS